MCFALLATALAASTSGLAAAPQDDDASQVEIDADDRLDAAAAGIDLDELLASIPDGAQVGDVSVSSSEAGSAEAVVFYDVDERDLVAPVQLAVGESTVIEDADGSVTVWEAVSASCTRTFTISPATFYGRTHVGTSWSARITAGCTGIGVRPSLLSWGPPFGYYKIVKDTNTTLRPTGPTGASGVLSISCKNDRNSPWQATMYGSSSGVLADTAQNRFLCGLV